MRFWDSCSGDASTVLGACNSEGRFDLGSLMKNEEEVVFYFYFYVVVYCARVFWDLGLGGVWCVVGRCRCRCGVELRSYFLVSSFPFFFYFLVPSGRVRGRGGEGRDLALGFRIFRIVYCLSLFTLPYLWFSTL